MDKALANQNFFKNLTSDLQKQCISFCKYRKKKEIYKKFASFLLLVTGAFFIISFKNVLFVKRFNLSLNQTFYYAKCLVFILGGFLLSDSISRNSSKKYDKSYYLLKHSILSDICTCTDDCNCKNELKIFFKKYNINL